MSAGRCLENTRAHTRTKKKNDAFSQTVVNRFWEARAVVRRALHVVRVIVLVSGARLFVVVPCPGVHMSFKARVWSPCPTPHSYASISRHPSAYLRFLSASSDFSVYSWCRGSACAFFWAFSLASSSDLQLPSTFCVMSLVQPASLQSLLFSAFLQFELHSSIASSLALSSPLGILPSRPNLAAGCTATERTHIDACENTSKTKSLRRKKCEEKWVLVFCRGRRVEWRAASLLSPHPQEARILMSQSIESARVGVGAMQMRRVATAAAANARLRPAVIVTVCVVLSSGGYVYISS